MTEKLKTGKKKQTSATELIRYAVKGIEEKKGADVVCINLKKIPNSACDYFVICEGSSRTQVQAIADSVEEFVKKNTGDHPWHVEGRQNAEWVLIDYVDVAVHIFQPEARSHYNLENLWADAEKKEIKAEVPKRKIQVKKVNRKTKITIKKSTKKASNKLNKKPAKRKKKP